MRILHANPLDWDQLTHHVQYARNFAYLSYSTKECRRAGAQTEEAKKPHRTGAQDQERDVSVAETGQDHSPMASSGIDAADADSAKKSESRACKMHIVGGIAMLAVGVALLVVT